VILDFTAPTKEQINAVNNLVGAPYSLFQIVRMGGIGSHKMILFQYSIGFVELLRKNQNLIYGNIELRPNGLIIHLSHYNSRFSWAIPFYRLSIFQSSNFTIHGDGEFLRFRMDGNFHRNKDFIEKILRLKIESEKNIFIN
jgi:hypothetical protein